MRALQQHRGLLSASLLTARLQFTAPFFVQEIKELLVKDAETGELRRRTPDERTALLEAALRSMVFAPKRSNGPKHYHEQDQRVRLKRHKKKKLIKFLQKPAQGRDPPDVYFVRGGAHTGSTVFLHFSLQR